MYLDYIESEMAKENLLTYMEQEARKQELSMPVQNRIGRYKVSDEEIKDLLFEVSLRGLCMLADKTLMEYYPDETANEAEVDRTIDIIAQGMTRKYLTNKQKWCLASFIIYYYGFNKEEL